MISTFIFRFCNTEDRSIGYAAIWLSAGLSSSEKYWRLCFLDYVLLNNLVLFVMDHAFLNTNIVMSIDILLMRNPCSRFDCIQRALHYIRQHVNMLYDLKNRTRCRRAPLGVTACDTSRHYEAPKGLVFQMGLPHVDSTRVKFALPCQRSRDSSLINSFVATAVLVPFVPSGRSGRN